MSRHKRKGSHTVYDLRVHLVWITKYRYPVLTGKVGLRVRELIRQFCDASDIRILKGRVSKDHIHLYISYSPKWSVSDLIKRIKGRTSRKVQEEFKNLSKTYWGKHFWAVGYGAFSSGHVNDAVIQAYLDNHDKHGNHNDDDFVVE